MTVPCAKVDAFADGALTPGDATLFERHLTACRRCQGALREVLLLDALVADATAGRWPRLAVLDGGAAVRSGPSARGRATLRAMSFDPVAHRAAVLAWRKARHERLRSATGWLTLVDRFPLDEGENQLPIGTVVVADGAAHFQPAPGTGVTFGGAPAEPRARRVDAGPETFLVEGRSYEIVGRAGAIFVRVRDPESAARLRFTGIPAYPVDPAWRITAAFESHPVPRRLRHAYEEGAGDEREAPGLVRFTVAGRSVTLEPTWEDAEGSARPGGRLFLAFADETNRDETYPAGRFLYLDPPAPEARTVVLDFNLAFNPPCALTPHVSCPLVPAAHRLPFRVEAGERRYEGDPPSVAGQSSVQPT